MKKAAVSGDEEKSNRAGNVDTEQQQGRNI